MGGSRLKTKPSDVCSSSLQLERGVASGFWEERQALPAPKKEKTTGVDLFGSRAAHVCFVFGSTAAAMETTCLPRSRKPNACYKRRAAVNQNEILQNSGLNLTSARPPRSVVILCVGKV